MKIKIINPKYEYADTGDLTFTANCQLFDDNEKFLFERNITSTKNVSNSNWYEELQNELVMQRNGIAMMYQQMILPITSLFPCCSTPDEIASRIAQTIEEISLPE